MYRQLMEQSGDGKISKKAAAALAFGALGVVYGDIGTSPLYAVNEIMFGHAEVARTPNHILGIISLLIWSLTIIVAIKYIVFVLRADSDGEGGVFAILSLILKNKKGKVMGLIMLLLLAAGLLYGDGVITPAISVLSAVEGLGVVTKSVEHLIVPITIAILTGLFLIQKKGTAKIGKLFSPIIVVWFFAIGFWGLTRIVGNPEIIQAFNPLNAIRFVFSTPLTNLMVIMGSVMLVVTGGEAMYADMGHFGKGAIRISWFSIVYPMLILNYLGQGAYLLSGGQIINNNIFFSMIPSQFLIPMVIIATLATIIASQALISGAFSLTTQAVSLGYLPRLKIIHTNSDHHGQIYVPFVNGLLYVGCIVLILIFESSQNIASAYGLAVSGVMVVTSLGMIYISQNLWNWSKIKSYGIFGSLLAFESFFLFSNLLKVVQGGWIPLFIASTIVFTMIIWKLGRDITAKTHAKLSTMTIQDMIDHRNVSTVALTHTSVFMTESPILNKTDKVPPILEVFWKRYGVLPKNIILLNVNIEKTPYVKKANRYVLAKLHENGPTGNIIGLEVNFGFMEDPNVEKVLQSLSKDHEINFEDDPNDWLVHIIHSRLYFGHNVSRFKKLLFKIYKFMNKNSRHADHFFSLGRHLDLTIEAVPTVIN